MKNTLRSKKVIIPAVAVLALLGVGGGVAVATVGDDDELTGKVLDRASKVALDHVGEGTVTAAERSDDGEDPEIYEIEVTREDGTEVDVLLDEDFAVLGSEDDRSDRDRDDDADDGADDGGDDGADDDGFDGDDDGADDRDEPGEYDADDRALSAADRKRAEQAARGVVAGTVTDVEASDDRVAGRDAAYEAEVIAKDGTEWTVWIDADFAVIDKSRED